MRLTQSSLKEYVEIDELIKKLEAKKSAIRDAIKERNEPEFKMGDFLVTAKEFKQEVPAHTRQGVRISVKKVA